MSWDKAIEFTLKWEGGYINDPKDPGGETKFGISKRSHPEIDIKNLDLEQAKNIYKKKYWDILCCDKLSEPLDIVVFDTAVNCGITRANTWLRLTDSWETFMNLRKLHYEKLRDYRPKIMNVGNPQPMSPYQKFFKGWMNRWNALDKLVRTC